MQRGWLPGRDVEHGVVSPVEVAVMFVREGVALGNCCVVIRAVNGEP